MKKAIGYFLLALSWLAYVPMVFLIFQDFDLKMAVASGNMVCIWPFGPIEFAISMMMAVFVAAFVNEEAMDRLMLIMVLSILVPVVLESFLKI